MGCVRRIIRWRLSCCARSMARIAIERVTKQTVERVVLPNLGGLTPSAARTAKPGLAIRSAVAPASKASFEGLRMT